MKNRLIASIIFLVFAQYSIAQSCIPTGLGIFSQEQVDNFASDYPGCTEIEGSLYILNNSSTDITNLDGLSMVTSIGGDLFIKGQSQLQNLSGLEQLQTVNGYIDISDNVVLEDISALNGLNTLGSAFTVYNNPALEIINNFEALSNFSGLLQIYSNENLSLVNGLNNIETLQGIYLYNNSSLTTFVGLDNLTTVTEYVLIDKNPVLSEYSAGPQLTTIGEYLTISENNNLSICSGFNALEIIGGSFKFELNHSMVALSDFQSLETIGGSMEIAFNDNLSQLFQPTTLQSVGSHVIVNNNDVLTDMTGLENLSAVNGILTIKENEQLSSLSGLENISTIGTFNFYGNELISDLSPLSNLDTIFTSISISRQPELLNFQDLTDIKYINTITIGLPSEPNTNGLQNFTGLENLTTLSTLNLYENSSLTSLEGFNGLTYLGDMVSFNNDGITDFTGLENVTEMNSIALYSSDGFVNCNGLSNLNSIAVNMQILLCDGFEDFTGLDNLSSVGILDIGRNESLTSLNGLEALTTVDSLLFIYRNEILTDLSGISNIDLSSHTDSISINQNDILSTCGYENICDYILTGGPASAYDNATGCNDLNDLIQSCFEFQDHTSFVGQVTADLSMDCIEDPNENGLPNCLINVQNSQYNYTISADSNGFYDIPVLAGEYTSSVISPSAFWTPCFTDTLIEATAMNDSITTNFLMLPQGDCPFIDWNLTLPPLRICGSRTVVLDYCNLGALPAEDAVFALTYDENITIDSASAPYTIDTDGTIFFELETLDLFDCGSITMSMFLDCDSVEIDEVLCVNVDLMSDDLCTPDGLWDGSNITASGRCENDSIFFELKNIGAGDMGEDAQFRVDILIEDIVLLHDADDYQLLTGDSIILGYELAGDGFRIEADQTPGHPIYTEASAVVPNCTEMVNDLILALFPTNNGDPFSETFCTFAINSYDPNIKTAIPRGIGENHEIDKDWELNYTIQFQNTGNDVAYLVTIRDTLSENVDLNTLRVHGATHDFTWELTQNRELIFTFADINLPDSTSNEPESHGHISYAITPLQDILPGEVITNRAGIYFDFNEPIITNTVLHTIKKPVVVNTEDLEICYGEVLLENTITQDTSVQELTSYATYDSIHLFHIDALPLSFGSAMAEVTIGETFEGVIIETDTSFVVSYVAQNGCDSLVTYEVSALVSTKDLNDVLNIRVFPNPVEESLYIESMPVNSTQDWTLTNTLGKVVWRQTLTSKESLSTILMGHLEKGIYILRLSSDQGVATWKVLKE